MQIHRPPPRPSNGGVPNVIFKFFFSFFRPLLSRVTRHQWIFITDTIDAVYRPDEITPEAMLDQLSEIAGGLPPPQVSVRCLSRITCVNTVCSTGKYTKFLKCCFQCPLHTRVKPSDAPPPDAHTSPPNRFHSGPGPIFLKRERRNL